jgi:hypothetical protein
MFFFKSPFTCIVVGATSSGKSYWVKRLLENRYDLIYPPQAEVLYCYGELNPLIMEYRNQGIEIHNGIPDPELIKSRSKPLLLIIDDLMLDIQPEYLDVLFTRGSHNWNVSIVFVTQALYGRNIKTARANAHYLVLMRNPQAKQNIRTLGSQMFPGQLKFFMESFNDATAVPYSYLLVDSHPNTDDRDRLITNIFPGEQTTHYLPL